MSLHILVTKDGHADPSRHGVVIDQTDPNSDLPSKTGFVTDAHGRAVVEVPDGREVEVYLTHQHGVENPNPAKSKTTTPGHIHIAEHAI